MRVDAGMSSALVQVGCVRQMSGWTIICSDMMITIALQLPGVHVDSCNLRLNLVSPRAS